jgi:hypothetical protein
MKLVMHQLALIDKKSRRRLNLVRGLLVLSAMVVFGGCAPLTHKIISLDGASAENLDSVALLIPDTRYPLLLRGLDGHPLDTVRVPSALRTWSFVVSPGKHLLWVSSVPYGHPFIPQFIRCYTIDVTLEAAKRYILRYDATSEKALLLHQGDKEPLSYGCLVDKPLVFQRSCRWN